MFPQSHKRKGAGEESTVSHLTTELQAKMMYFALVLALGKSFVVDTQSDSRPT